MNDSDFTAFEFSVTANPCNGNIVHFDLFGQIMLFTD